MTDCSQDISAIRRPRLLVRAARFGLADYVRDRDLKRFLGAPTALRPGHALRPLLEREAACEEDRRSGSAGYSAARHVGVLTALMAESRLNADPLS